MCTPRGNRADNGRAPLTGTATTRIVAPMSTAPARVSSKFRLVLFATILTIQVAIPLLQLRAERPARFGWQMFSGVQLPARFTVLHIDGTVDTVTVVDYLVKPRQEVDPFPYLPPHLCRQVPTAVAVAVHEPPVVTPEFRCP